MASQPQQQPKPPPGQTSGGGRGGGNQRGGRRGGNTARGGRTGRGPTAESSSNNASSSNNDKDSNNAKKTEVKAPTIASSRSGGGNGRGGGARGNTATGAAGGRGLPSNRSAFGTGKKDAVSSKVPQKQAATQTQAEKDRIAKQEQEKQANDKVKLEAHAVAKAKANEERRIKQRKEDALNKLKHSRELILSMIDTYHRHAEYRAALQEDVLAQSRANFEASKKTLKTDLKKCTAFVKKIKSGSAWSFSKVELLKEAKSLNLTRYVEELVTNVLESQPKASEIDTLAAFCVCLHERYPEFMPSLIQGLKDGLLHGQNIKTKRLNLRILVEFYLVGLLNDSKLIVKVVTEAAGAKDNGDNCHEYFVQDGGLLVAFAKSAGFEIFGRLPTAVQQAVTYIQTTLAQRNVCAEEDTISLPPKDQLEEASGLITELMHVSANRNVDIDVCRSLTQHCLGAYQFMADSLVQTHKKLLKLEKRCEQDRILSGALPEAREKGLADARTLKENLERTVEALADVLDQPVPHLVAGDDAAQGGGGGLEVWTKSGEGGENDFGPFGDAETRAFYTDIPDLLATIPPALLGSTAEQVEKRKEDNKKRFEAQHDEDVGDDGPSELLQMTEAELNDAEGDIMLADQANEAAEEENKDTPHYRLMMLLEQELPECHQRAQIDELTERFCTNHGSSKSARKRLIRTLFLVPRNRLDLLPYYSRMAATIDRIWPDVVAELLVSELEQQFHGQTKYKKNQHIESRFRTARYISELTKFSVAPPIVFLRCLRRCLDDFTGSNVDVLCCLLETCGRFIYRLNAQTNTRLTSLMEIMIRLSKAKNLDERSQSLIKAAMYSVNPLPAGPRKQAKEYPPLETYLRHLFLVDLDSSESSISSTVKQLLRLPWNDPSYDCAALVANLMLKACRKGRYKTIQAIASVAERIRAHRSAGEVSVKLIDLVVEELRWGIEHPDFRDQQRVLMYARLLGELFCSSQISGQVLLQHLYDFINIGHEIPHALRQASKKLVAANGDMSVTELPPLSGYKSATGISQTIQEDKELDDSELVTMDEAISAQPKPVAVSEHSVYDPRVPTPIDPPTSAYRIKLVCTLLDVAANLVVTRANLPRLKGFLAAFQRYLFIKSSLPVELEFSLLDTFDVLDSRWRQVTKSLPSNKNQSLKEEGFPRYSSWLDAHNATVAMEESGQLDETIRADTLMDAKSSSIALDDSMHDDESNSQLEDDEDSIESGQESVSDKVEGDLLSEGPGTAEQSAESSDDEYGEESSEDEEDFDEEAYMRQLEEEAFERELRKITMDALEKGKNLSRKQVAELMPSGSQISTIKKKTLDPTPAESLALPMSSTVNALGGKMGVNFQLLKKGNKGKIEIKSLIVPSDNKLAQIASKKDDEAIRERDAIKQRVLRYEAESANAEFTGGNVYLEQEKLVKIRNRLSMDDIDKNFGTSGGNLRLNAADTKPKPAAPSTPLPGRLGSAGFGGRGGPGRGRGGRFNSGGRTLFS
ncbi:hypothetical protein MPSEU_000840300 [Mayamaea pseudoterrestris]|nr:hypothetical protein MPSEU_000840300 [Mayamaea pseudoterrestris]